MKRFKVNSTSLKLVSNSPVIDEQKYGVYADILHEKIQDKDVCNIGVIGAYGAGKSSLIKTYQHKYHKRLLCKDTKLTKISLANFNDTQTINEEQPSDSKHGGVQDIDCAVEKSILEQFLYKVGKNKVPYSKINRINTSHGWLSFRLALYLIATIALIGCAILEFFKLLPNSNGSNFYIFSGCAATTALLFIYLMFYNNKINKIAVKDIQAEFCELTSGSVLNTFIDEIIYYFQKTKVQVVVIEDLDRFNNTSIFSKLRELNFLINNSQLVKQKVTFVYAIKDDLFRTENDRAKFFDYILSLIPVLSFTNVRGMLKKELESTCSKEMELPELYIHEVSHFITEMRVLKNIVNDYVTYYHLLKLWRLSDSQKNIKLFSLMVYKNLHPADFAELQYGKGDLADAFESKHSYVVDLIKQKEEKIAALNNKKLEAKQAAIHSFELLRKAVIGCMVTRYQLGNYHGTDVSQLKSFEGVTGRIVYHGNYHWYAEMWQIDEDLGENVVDIEQRIQDQSESKQKQLQLEIDGLQQQIRQCRNYTMSEYLTLEQSTDIQGELKRFLLANGYIDETYKDYIVSKEDDLISARDQAFVRKVLEKQPIDVMQSLEKPELVMREISQERFSDRFIFNYSLIEATLNAKTNDEEVKQKQKSLKHYLTSRSPEVIGFWKQYLSDQQEFTVLFNQILPDYDCFCRDILLDESMSPEQKDRLLSALFAYGDIELFIRQNQENVLTQYLSKHPNAIGMFAYIHADVDLFVDVLQKLSVQLITVSHEGMNNDHIAQYVMDELIKNDLYEISLKNLEFILHSHYNFENCQKAVLSYVLKTNNPTFIAYVEANHQTIINEYASNVSICEEEQIGIEWILKNKTLPLSEHKKFVSNLKTTFDVYEGIDKELLLYAYEQDKIYPTWANVVMSKKKKYITLQSILTYLDRNAQILSADALEDKDIELLLCNEVSFTDLTGFSIYSKGFAVKLKANEITRDEIAAILVNNCVIEANVENLVLAKSTIKVLIPILLKAPDVIEEMNGTTFANNIMDLLLNNQDLSNEIKAKLIYKMQQTYTPSTDTLKEHISKIIIKNKIERCCERLLNILLSSSMDSGIKIDLLDVYGNDIDKSKVFSYLKQAVPKVASLETQLEIKVPMKEYDTKILNLFERHGIFKITKYKHQVKIKKI